MVPFTANKIGIDICNEIDCLYLHEETISQNKEMNSSINKLCQYLILIFISLIISKILPTVAPVISNE